MRLFTRELQRVDAALDDLRAAINNERTHRLQLANEQRAYVDGADAQLKAYCRERFEANIREHARMDASVAELRQRGFWGRLNWLLTGR